VRVLLDTSVLIFSTETPERLSKRAYETLRDARTIREISVVSLAEIAIKNTLGKLNLSADVVRLAMHEMLLRFLPFTADHAYRMFELPLHHRDPFDRQIIAQALHEEIPVITPDRTFHLYKGLKVIW